MKFECILAAAALAASAAAQEKIPANYDEFKVGSYTLPEPLRLENGEPVTDPATWRDKRRPELIRLFEENVYGRSPGRPADMSWDVFDLDTNALAGTAVRKQVTIYFSKDKNGPQEDLLIYLPAASKAPVPVILSLNFSGNHTLVDDPAVKLANVWDRKTNLRHQASPDSRGKAKDFAGAVQKALAHGYGFVSIYYGDIEPDFKDGFPFGVRASAPDDWGAIAAWGWGLSRALDYMETDRDIDAMRVAIFGMSRLGKTVLWAGARDTRFAMVLANCSGEGGASLARRNYGETVKHLNVNFPYQFAKSYQKYGDHVDQLPVDTHELIALIAPRYVYLGTGDQDQWGDPKGEFLAAVAAGPVYRLLGKQGLDTDKMPPLDRPIMHDIAFHTHTGKHEVLPWDWDQFLAFMEMHLGDARTTSMAEAPHPFLYCGEWQQRGKSDQTIYVVRGGKIVWSYSIPAKEELGDCTMLSNGNIVFSRRLGASEITPAKQIVWNYVAPPNTEIHTAQPLGSDRVLIVQNGNPAKLMIIRKATGNIEKEMVLRTARPDNIHGQFRHVRMTKAGTFLVAHLDLGKVVEYDAAGNEIWSVTAPSAWAAVRLNNGNTLISGNQHGYVREVNPKGETVWEIARNDLPGIPLFTVQEADRLANGNTVINNWPGSLKLEDWPSVVQVIEVTPDKRVVWALRDWTTLGPASSTQLLDQKGSPENGELQR